MMIPLSFLSVFTLRLEVSPNESIDVELSYSDLDLNMPNDLEGISVELWENGIYLTDLIVDSSNFVN